MNEFESLIVLVVMFFIFGIGVGVGSYLTEHKIENSKHFCDVTKKEYKWEK